MSRGTKTSSFGANSRISHDSSSYYESRLYEGLVAPSAHSEPDNPLPEEHRNRIIHASSEQMSDLPERCINLMVTSPPYNVTKEYDDNLSLREYLDLLKRVFTETSWWMAGALASMWPMSGASPTSPCRITSRG